MSINCPKCNSNNFFKNGIVREQQRYCCKDCSFNFTELTDINKVHPDTKPPEAKKLANILYLKGNSFRDIANIIAESLNIKVSHQSIIKWIKKGELKSKKIK